MYCNSCLESIKTNTEVFCSDCGMPLHEQCANHCLECNAILCDECYKENRYRCSNCIDIKKNIKTIRRSYIKQYEDCPYSLYLMMIEGIIPPMSSYAQLGIITHDIIEKMQVENITKDKALRILHSEVEEWNINTPDSYSVITTTLLENGVNSIENFSKLLPSLSEKALTEKKIEFSLSEKLPTVNCTLDRISIVDNDYHIHDWKTGRPLSGKAFTTEIQPPLYIYAVYKEYNILPKSFTLHYLAFNKSYIYNHINDFIYEIKTARSLYKINILDTIEKTKKILSNISKHNFPIPDERKVGWRCNKMCWYGISGECEKSTTEKWKEINNERSKKEKRATRKKVSINITK